MSTMRIKIAEHMVLSKRTSAHVTTIHRVDMTKVAKHARSPQGHFQSQLRLLAHLPAVHHARHGGGAAPVPAAERFARRQQHHLPQRNQHRHRGGAGKRPDRAGDPQADEKNVLGLQRSIVDLARAPVRASSSPTKCRAAHSPSPISAASAA
jgi:pyruvate dehydrogenase E2 component (dihydrolipoamide acetyltransferase)